MSSRILCAEKTCFQQASKISGRSKDWLLLLRVMHFLRQYVYRGEKTVLTAPTTLFSSHNTVENIIHKNFTKHTKTLIPIMALVFVVHLVSHCWVISLQYHLLVMLKNYFRWVDGSLRTPPLKTSHVSTLGGPVVLQIEIIWVVRH